MPIEICLFVFWLSVSPPIWMQLFVDDNVDIQGVLGSPSLPQVVCLFALLNAGMIALGLL